jgi:hypothetical protein
MLTEDRIREIDRLINEIGWKYSYDTVVLAYHLRVDYGISNHELDLYLKDSRSLYDW